MKDVYLIYSNDYFLIKKEIDKLIKDVKDVVKYDLSVCKINDLLDDASCPSIFGDKKVLIGENAYFLTTNKTNVNHDLEYFERYLEAQNHDNVIILTILEDKLDERKKIVKKLKQYANVIYKDIPSNIPSFVINEFKSFGYDIDYETANYFVDYVGKNVDVIISEINKMVVYKQNDKKITKENILEISSKAFNDNIFELCDGIINKNYEKTFNSYNDLMALKEEPIKIIALLASQFTLIYQCKLLLNDGKNIKEIEDILKVHPYRIKLATNANYNITAIKNILIKLHNLDYDIKSGKILKNVGLDSFLLHL